LFVSGAPGAESWVEDQRRRLRVMVLAAASTCAEQLERAGAAPAAARAARRALALQPDDERDVRALLAMLERCGDSAGALLSYQEYARRLAVELETEPAAETRQLIEAMRRRREVAAVPEPAREDAARPEDAPATPAVARTAPAPRTRRRWPAIAAAVVVLAGAAWVAKVATTARRLPPVDPQLVVVAPFRVADSDSSLAFLGDGLMDLLSAKLIGGGGPRAADPRAVLAAWRAAPLGDEDAARSAARKLGAARVVLGSVVGRSGRLVITAALVGVLDGTHARDASVAGPLDSLSALVEQLALRLLAGEVESGGGGVGTSSLDALREYLQGRAEFRRSHYDAAIGHLQTAIALDSNFALAALALAYAADWVPGSTAREARSMAWRLRDRLAPAERAFLRAVVGPDYPQPSYPARLIDAWERATHVAADRPEVWYGLGDLLLHYGALFGRDSGFTRAEAAFARAVALDSGFTAPLGHLVQIAIQRDDRPAVRVLAAIAHRVDSTSDAALFLRWRVALALGDSTTVRRIEAGLESLPLMTLRRIAEWGTLEGARVEIAHRAAQLYLRRATSFDDQAYAERLAMHVAADVGRFTERDSMRSALLRRYGSPIGPPIAMAYTDLWLGDGDPERLAREVPAAEARLARAQRHGGAGTDALALYIWFASRGDSASTARADHYLDLAIAMPLDTEAHLLLRARRAVTRHAPEAPQLIEEVDSLRAAAVAPDLRTLRNLEFAELLARHGETARALSVIRRWAFEPAMGLPFLAFRARLEGQLAAATGDTTGAIRAFRHYLALRANPDPGARIWADSVRTELAQLETRRNR